MCYVEEQHCADPVGDLSQLGDRVMVQVQAGTAQRAGHATEAESDELVDLSVRLLMAGRRSIGAD